MANLLQSSQNKSTCAPSYYTDYLTNLASQGNTALNNAQYVGATCLQNKAFCNASNTQCNFAGNFQAGTSAIGCAANKNISGATTGYLNKATNASPLCAANPYISTGANMNLGQVAQCYMSPYLHGAVQDLSDVAQRNLQMNLAPQATAGAVGSGQFGSQRGAQALGQVMANAQQCLTSQLANLTNQGYSTAMTGAQAKLAGLNTAGATASSAQDAQNRAQIAAATEAANAAQQCAQAKTQAGLALGTLGTEGTNAKIACENAMATLGAQKQAILQNAQCYDFSKLGKYSSLMQGHTIPTNVKTTMCMSPLSAIAAGAAAGKASGIVCKLGCWAKKGWCWATNKSNCMCFGGYCICNPIKIATGGSIHKAQGGHIGCKSTSHLGGLPTRRK